MHPHLTGGHVWGEYLTQENLGNPRNENEIDRNENQFEGSVRLLSI